MRWMARKTVGALTPGCKPAPASVVARTSARTMERSAGDSSRRTAAIMVFTVAWFQCRPEPMQCATTTRQALTEESAVMTRIVVVYHSDGYHRATPGWVCMGVPNAWRGCWGHCTGSRGADRREGAVARRRSGRGHCAVDGLAFGCPTLMGMVSAPFKPCMAATFAAWGAQRCKDGFAGSSANPVSPNGDKRNAQIQLRVLAAQMGLLWIPMGGHPGANCGVPASRTTIQSPERFSLAHEPGDHRPAPGSSRFGRRSAHR